MNARTDARQAIATTTTTLLLVGGLLACGAARADGGNVPVEVLKAGQAAQEQRWAEQMRRLDPETRALLEGRTEEARVLRERGNQARHVRQDIRRREWFERELGRGTADVEQPRAHRPPARHVTFRDQVEARSAHHGQSHGGLSADELDRRGRIAQHNRGVHAPHAGAGTHARPAPAHAAPRGRLGAKVAGGVVGGAVAGWAIETATGVDVPDPVDAVQWTAESLQRPQDMPQRVGELAVGAVELTGQVATSLTRPDRLAVNLANGAADVAKTGAHLATHPDQAVAAVGNTVVGTGKLAVDLGTGLGKGVATVASGSVRAVTHPAQTANAVGRGVVKAANGTARAVNKVGCGVGKLFKPRQKC